MHLICSISALFSCDRFLLITYIIALFTKAFAQTALRFFDGAGACLGIILPRRPSKGLAQTTEPDVAGPLRLSWKWDRPQASR